MHIGKKIRQTLKEKGHTVVWFANELSCHRTNIYKIFDKPSIDTYDLMRISRILDYNFFDYLSNIYEKNKTLPPPTENRHK